MVSRKEEWNWCCLSNRLFGNSNTFPYTQDPYILITTNEKHACTDLYKYIGGATCAYEDRFCHICKHCWLDFVQQCCYQNLHFVLSQGLDGCHEICQFTANMHSWIWSKYHCRFRENAMFWDVYSRDHIRDIRVEYSSCENHSSLSCGKFNARYLMQPWLNTCCIM